MDKYKVGLAITGSFCTFKKIIPLAKALAQDYDLTIILSEAASEIDTRFGEANDFRNTFEEISGKPLITSIKEAEPLGPRKLLDALVIAPCTGNTLGKLANGVADSSVTLATKAHLRNSRPVIIAVSTNDGLAGNFSSIAELYNRKNFYFVPFGQDDFKEKPHSLVADFSKTKESLELALKGKQIQPILIK